ncbi:hypothetical protein GCK72_002491 [Caenorhabditis remanei]|uniref:3-oxo-5-alpha-steroid 4-dehydrogenase C-terminal domain-containing protein n=1 Tax=Caenorhabditis remanei TaxID=31234 RepID=A0A6A5HR28_CAERE|nr:hypothetical protein GCK72_002491 [Caenorhabditis remanei]KAF1770670.1 hypothetical protein GCK72_002491 [Caenorhabditis remanei]
MLFAIIIVGSWLMTTCGIFVFLTLSNTGKQAEYGRYSNPSTSRWTFPANFAWAVQEAPAFFIPFYFYWTDQHLTEFGQFLTCLMMFHYAYRSFIYPFLLNSKNRTPAKIVLMAFAFCTWNGFIQGSWNAYYQPEFDKIHPRFFVFFGVWLFVIGFIIHLISDLHLISLRRNNPAGSYGIPRGHLFEYISCPNYFGECLQWIGYAIAARSFPAIAFAFFTILIQMTEWLSCRNFGD